MSLLDGGRDVPFRGEHSKSLTLKKKKLLMSVNNHLVHYKMKPL